MQHGAVLGDAQKRIYGCKIDAAADGQKNALECSTSPINAGLSSDCCLSCSVTSLLGQFGTKVPQKKLCGEPCDILASSHLGRHRVVFQKKFMEQYCIITTSFLPPCEL